MSAQSVVKVICLSVAVIVFMLFSCVLVFTKIVQGECKTSSLLERFAEPQPILYKDIT